MLDVRLQRKEIELITSHAVVRAISVVLIAKAFSGYQSLRAEDDPGMPTTREDRGLTLWYKQPARLWREGLKVGNGRLGATVFGRPEEERIGLNHTWLVRKWKLGG